MVIIKYCQENNTRICFLFCTISWRTSTSFRRRWSGTLPPQRYNQWADRFPYSCRMTPMALVSGTVFEAWSTWPSFDLGKLLNCCRCRWCVCIWKGNFPCSFAVVGNGQWLTARWLPNEVWSANTTSATTAARSSWSAPLCSTRVMAFSLLPKDTVGHEWSCWKIEEKIITFSIRLRTPTWYMRTACTITIIVIVTGVGATLRHGFRKFYIPTCVWLLASGRTGSARL